MTKSFMLIEVEEHLKEAIKEAIRQNPAVSGVYTVVTAVMSRASSMT